MHDRAEPAPHVLGDRVAAQSLYRDREEAHAQRGRAGPRCVAAGDHERARGPVIDLVVEPGADALTSWLIADLIEAVEQEQEALVRAGEDRGACFGVVVLG